MMQQLLAHVTVCLSVFFSPGGQFPGGYVVHKHPVIPPKSHHSASNIHPSDLSTRICHPIPCQSLSSFPLSLQAVAAEGLGESSVFYFSFQFDLFSIMTCEDRDLYPCHMGGLGFRRHLVCF